MSSSYVADKGKALAAELGLKPAQLAYLCRCVLDEMRRRGALSRPMLSYHPSHPACPEPFGAPVDWERKMKQPVGYGCSADGKVPIGSLDKDEVSPGIQVTSFWRKPKAGGRGPSVERRFKVLLKRMGGVEGTEELFLNLVRFLMSGPRLIVPVELFGYGKSRVLLQANADCVLFELLPPEARFRCSVCNVRMPWVSEGAPCPACKGVFLPWPDEEVQRNRYVQRIQRRELIPLVAGEHTAQVTGDRRIELEGQFKDDNAALNVLACSPTLEMGIDGNLKTEAVDALIAGAKIQFEGAIGVAMKAWGPEIREPAGLTTEDDMRKALDLLPAKINDLFDRCRQQIVEIEKTVQTHLSLLKDKKVGYGLDLKRRLLGLPPADKNNHEADDRTSGHPMRRFAEFGILPGYEFPSEPCTVRLLGDPNEAEVISVERRFGLSQYRPGAQAHARGHRWKVVGLDLSSPWNPRTSDPDWIYCICKQCNLRYDPQQAVACPRCHSDQTLVSEVRAFAYGGFVAVRDDTPVLEEEDRYGSDAPGRPARSGTPRPQGLRDRLLPLPQVLQQPAPPRAPGLAGDPPRSRGARVRGGDAHQDGALRSQALARRVRCRCGLTARAGLPAAVREARHRG